MKEDQNLLSSTNNWDDITHWENLHKIVNFNIQFNNIL